MKQIAQEMNKHGKQIGRSAWLVFLGRFQPSMFLPLRELAQNLLRFSLKNADLASAVARVGSIAVLVSITACAQQQLDQFNKDMANLNTALAGGTASAGRPTGAPSALAQNSDAEKSTSTQLVVPADKIAAAALEAALPNIKKVVALHQCMRDGSSARLFAPYAVVGGENNIFVYGLQTGVYAPIPLTRYHDKSKCVSVRAIDQVTMLAMNAIQIRVVYLAEDSGEASNFQMQFMRAGDGSWKLSRIMMLS